MPGGGVLARFYRPGGGGFELLFCPGVGNSPIQKIARGEGWSGLELTGYINSAPVHQFGELFSS